MPTARSAAASARRAASATSAPCRRLGIGSDLRGRATDETGDVTRADDDGVDAGPLQRKDVVPVLHTDVGDGELAGRNVGEQPEDVVDRVLLPGLPAGEQEDLRVDALEGDLELLVVRHVEHALEAQ